MEEEIGSFLNYLTVEKGFSVNTTAAYRNDLHQLSSFVSLKGLEDRLPPRWASVDRSLLINYIVNLKERSYAPATVARKIAAVKSFFDFLVAEHVLEKDPTDGLGSPKVGKSLPKTVTVEEVEELLKQPDKRNTSEAARDKAMLELLYATGMRVSEMVSLNVENVNLKAGFVRCLGKGAKERIVVFHPTAAKALRDYMEKARYQLLGQGSEEALFLNRNGKRLTRQGFWLILKNYAKQANIGVDITPHTLRHSVATHMLHSGKMNLRELQEFLGHANIATTQIYTHLTSDHVRQVYEKTHPRAG
ncbi:MAG: site-specific tyrosine recombinase XerD [Dehalococcoidia bacterium]|nr:site-specific tyrosine recombinase XerD [Dehalococcoidia bacterium]